MSFCRASMNKSARDHIYKQFTNLVDDHAQFQLLKLLNLLRAMVQNAHDDNMHTLHRFKYLNVRYEYSGFVEHRKYMPNVCTRHSYRRETRPLQGAEIMRLYANARSWTVASLD